MSDERQGTGALRLTRREFARLSALAAAGVSVLGIDRAQGGRVRLTKYVDPLLRLPLAIPRRSADSDADYYELTMRQRPWRFHRELPETAAWGFWASSPSPQGEPIGLGYLGPTLIAHWHRPVVVRYRNRLPVTHLLRSSIDVTLWKNLPGVPPDPRGGRNPQDFPEGTSVWTVTHLHGAFDPPQADGYPTAWFTPDGRHGPEYGSLPGSRANEAIYAYPNDQRATMLWYHDHAMAITRLNKYAGLAGVYLLRDPFEEQLQLPRGDFEVPLIVQDRRLPPGRLALLPDQGAEPLSPQVGAQFLR